MQAFGIWGIVILAFIIFCIYFIFKSLQFVIQAVNLYKKMIIRHDAIISLLMDIRDNTKNYNRKILENAEKLFHKDPHEELKTCGKCNNKIPIMYKRCPKCGFKFD